MNIKDGFLIFNKYRWFVNIVERSIGVRNVILKICWFMRCVIGLMKYFVLIYLEFEVIEKGIILGILNNKNKDKVMW